MTEEQRECDHCGTVTRALRIWTPEELNGCACMCHVIRDRKAPKTTKKKGNRG